MRISVCGSQVPFVTGGAEALSQALVDRLSAAGHSAEQVNLPFSWSPRTHLLNSALAWRMISLDGGGQPPDLAIATRFPSYLVRHPNKVIWLIHQFRQVYDLLGSRFSDFDNSPEDQAMIAKITEMDRLAFREAGQIFTISKNVALRLQTSLGIEAKVLYPPPRLADELKTGTFGNYVFTASRLDSLKRVELLIDAVAASSHGLRAKIAGDGPQREALQQMIGERALTERIELLGRVEDDQLIRLYADANAVFYAPFDEDYGYVTVEAFKCGKPVVTTHDSGGVLEFVDHERTGLVTEPRPRALAAALDRFATDPDLAGRLGSAGQARVADIRWDRVIPTLTQSTSEPAT